MTSVCPSIGRGVALQKRRPRGCDVLQRRSGLVARLHEQQDISRSPILYRRVPARRPPEAHSVAMQPERYSSLRDARAVRRWPQSRRGVRPPPAGMVRLRIDDEATVPIELAPLCPPSLGRGGALEAIGASQAARRRSRGKVAAAVLEHAAGRACIVPLSSSAAPCPRAPWALRASRLPPYAVSRAGRPPSAAPSSRLGRTTSEPSGEESDSEDRASRAHVAYLIQINPRQGGAAGEYYRLRPRLR